MTNDLASAYLQWPDYAVIVIYFISILAIGLWVIYQLVSPDSFRLIRLGYESILFELIFSFLK